MKIQQKNKKLSIKHAVLLAAIVVSLVAAGIYAYTTTKQSNKVNSDTTSAENNVNSPENLPNTIPNKGDATPNASDQPLPPQPTSGDKRQVTVSITAANQNDDTLQIRTLIQVVVSDGTCTLSGKSPSGKSITKTAAVQAQATSSTCKGFDIPVRELSNEKWNFTINYKNETLEGSGSTDVVIR